MSAIPAWLMLFVGPFIVLNVVIGLVTYVTLLERKFAARMQSRVALTELLSRCPDFDVDEAGIVWAGGSYVRRPLSVPFRVTS